MTASPEQLFSRARELGLSLEPRGDKLAVAPAERLSPEFADVLRENKAVLLEWLGEKNPRPSGKKASEASEASEPDTSTRPKPDLDLPPDFFETFPKATGPRKPTVATQDRGGNEAQWIHVAKQILGGEFRGADSATCESLYIGLRSLAVHPFCREALQRLAAEPACPAAMKKDIRKLLA